MGSLEDVGPDVCRQVYMDLEYRKKWDEYVKGEFIKEQNFIVPVQSLYPEKIRAMSFCFLSGIERT